MKRTLLILLFATFCFNTKAQLVTIPDANFVTWLQTNVPAAMSGSQMDTTNFSITSLKTISISAPNIADLTGIQYFDSLIDLDCSGNGHLTSIPSLPNTLQTLNCGYDSLTNLPALPSSLQELICYGNQLQSLPTLPNSLQLLSCGNNNISCFPTFPSSFAAIVLTPNPFNCLPNYTGGMDSTTLAIPLCASGNSNGCPISTSCAPGVSFFLSKDTIPYTWDGYPAYSYQVTTATWYWGDGTSTIGLYPSHTYTSGGQYYVCVTAFSSCGDSANYCYSDSLWRTANSNMVYINIINNSTTHINQNTKNINQFNFYPNPTSDQFLIEANTSDKLTVDLYDLNGRHVLSKNVNNKSAIDVSDLNEGIYTVKIKTAEGMQNKKLVVVR